MVFDFDAAVGAPFRMQPGLRRLAAGALQLTPAAPGGRHMREKLAVLSAFAGQALLVAPGFDAGPALQALVDQALREHPALLRLDGGQLQAIQLGVGVDGDRLVELRAGTFGLGNELARCLQQLPAGWRLAGLLSLVFAEDFAVIDGDGRIPWLAVTLPSHWAPETKIGRRFHEVHAPVADNALLLNAADALARTVTSDQPWERFVWNITDHPRLHAHPERVSKPRWQHTAPANAWWRTERQTFIPVPGQRQAVFTIQVDLTPLAQAVRAPGRAQRLHAAVASMTPAVLAYRGLCTVRDPLLQWLAEQP
ncbi:MAG: DUF3445 domain-containing protein [Rubrivivax sp.]|nr:DUF3445 domain-containing protein [Rubrivivax sp.]